MELIKYVCLGSDPSASEFASESIRYCGTVLPHRALKQQIVRLRATEYAITYYLLNPDSSCCSFLFLLYSVVGLLST